MMLELKAQAERFGSDVRDGWITKVDFSGDIHKVWVNDTKEIHYTNVSCKLLCEKTALCKDYDNRKAMVPDCKILTPNNLKNLRWMPNTCAYKLLNDGYPLPFWHPLVSGNNEEIVKTGNSVQNRVINENEVNVDDLPEYIFDW